MKSSGQKIRKSNIELLRIIAMLMIMVLHSRYDGILATYDGVIDANHICRFLFESLAIVGVNLFVLISGYFGIHLKKRSACNLIFQVYFFALIGLIGWIASGGVIESKYIIKAVLPFSHTVWFIPSYVMLMIFSPILNSYLEQHSLKHITTMAGALYVISYAWGTVMPGTISGFGGYNWGWFVILYLTGHIIRRYTDSHHITKISCLLGYILCTMAIVIIALLQNYFPYGQSLMWSYDFPIIFVSSICLFLFFAQLDIDHNKVINWLAASAFAVLLFHVAPFSRYGDCCRYIYENYSGIACICLTAVCIITFYLTATLIDQARIYLFTKIFK